MCKKFFQKGQVLVLYALLLPIMFVFIGMAADFGWLYLNQSRLQNAADAAVTAGANRVIFKEQSLSDYTYATFIANSSENLEELKNAGIVSKRDTSDGDRVAKEYAAKNLASDGKLTSDGRIIDSWNSNPDNTVTFERTLYGVDKDDFDALYYTVTLTENFNHLFSIMDSFEEAKLVNKATAVAKITHVMRDLDGSNVQHGPDLYSTMVALRNSETYASWWHIHNDYKISTTDQFLKENFGTTDLMTIARSRSVQAKGNEYVEGNFYRTETLTLQGWSRASTGDGGETGKELKQLDFDDLFVDLKLDFEFKPSSDGDKDVPSTEGAYNLKTDNARVSNAEVFKYRIHDLINVGKWNGSSYEYVYKVRANKEAPDPMYVYIENENLYKHNAQGQTNPFSMNTVRQMIINVNVSNLAADERPIIFFYDGPEKYVTKDVDKESWMEKWRESWRYLDTDYKDNQRNSLPVILNLNADFRGILFVPNSPCVINGNGHSLEGFVIAEKYLALKTALDFPLKAENGTNLYKNGRGNEYYRDSAGNATYHKLAEGGTRFFEPVRDENGDIIYDAVEYPYVYYINLNKKTIDELPKVKPEDGKEYEEYIYSDPDLNIAPFLVYINTDDENEDDYCPLLYKYTLITEEKSNLTRTFAGSEKDYVALYPMYIDQLGDVQYKPLTNYFDGRPTPDDSAWHSNYNYSSENYSATDDVHEVIYKKSAFNISSAKYNSYKKFFPVDYTYLNKGDADIFYTTRRSTWID